jgi:ABC-2 type transport system ATP-binding protein
MVPNQNKRVKECSKGMLQRLSLAQALVHDPDFLVLDEPITGLDPLGLTEMRELILKLNGQGKTILFSSHIIAEVEKLAHRVAILSGGERVQLIERSEWEGCPGRLEDIFVETVRSRGETGLG